MIKLVAFQAGGGAHMRLRVVEQQTAKFLFRSDRPFFFGGWACMKPDSLRS